LVVFYYATVRSNIVLQNTWLITNRCR